MEFTLLEFGAVGGEGGCEVHVVGDHPALGCWSPAQSVPLHPSGTSEGLPFWKTRTPISVPSGTTIQYKYLLMKDGLLHRWENFDGNRVCADVQGSSMCLLEDELDKLSHRGYPTSGGSRNSSRPGSRASNSTGALSSSGARHSSASPEAVGTSAARASLNSSVRCGGTGWGRLWRRIVLSGISSLTDVRAMPTNLGAAGPPAAATVPRCP